MIAVIIAAPGKGVVARGNLPSEGIFMEKKLLLLLSLFALFVLHGVAFALDPLAVAPNLYKKLFENEKVRVMEVTFNPGDKIKKHSHPDHFVTVLEPGKIKIFKEDGSAQEMVLTQEQVVWIPAETHWAENIGTTRVKLLVSELKG